MAQDALVTPPIRQSVEDANSAQANGIAQPMTEKSWYLFWDRLGKMANRQNWMVNVGTHADRPPAANMPNGAIYVEFDRGVIYQNWTGAWQYLAGTMYGTFSPDQRPTDLGSHDAGFDFRTTDQPPREFIWSGTAWVEVTAVTVGTHANRPAPASEAEGNLYVEYDRGGVIYQNWVGGWEYLAGTMWGTLVPDQRPTDLGSRDAGFDFRTTDAPPREFIWSGTAWIEIGAEYLVNGTLIGTRPALNLIAGSNVTISGSDNAGSDRVDVTVSSSGGGTGGAVSSVFGRTGAVAAQAGDYNATQVTNAANTASSYADPAWITSLSWSKITGAPATGVSSVFGRTGAVTAASGDYSAFYVPVARQVIAGTGLTGGGALSADVTLTAKAMGPSGASHSAGIVPDPGATAGTTRFLREDATWINPQTPWLQNIDGGNFQLTNVANIGVRTTAATVPVDFVGPSLVYTAPSTSSQGTLRLATGTSALSDALYFGVHTGDYSWIQAILPGTAVRNLLLNPNGGNVGIATASPLYQLDVRTPGATAAQVHIASTNTDAGAYLGSTNDSVLHVAAGVAFNGTNFIAKATTATLLQMSGAGYFQFNSDTGLTVGNAYTPTGRMIILASGNVGIGTTSPTHQLQLSTDDAAKLTTNTWTIASGAKVKKHIKRLKGGLEIINKLSPTEAQYNGEGGTPDGQRVVSLIAEEVREVLPHTVTEDADGNLGFNVHEVIHHLILAVQQLSKKLEKMEAAAY